MTCKMCAERGKTWNGDDPKCAFVGAFEDNWNCATIGALRDICYEGQNPMPAGVDYQYCEDQKYATVNIDDIETPNGNRIGMALWVSWYKRRGSTDAVWVLDNHHPPRIPTEEEVVTIVNHFRTRLPVPLVGPALRGAGH